MSASSSKHSQKKELYLAKNISELNKRAELPAKLKTTANMLVKAADKILQKAVHSQMMNDEEDAYVMFMKYLNVYMFVKRTVHYKEEKTGFDSIFNADNVRSAINTAEELSESLKRRYDLIEAGTVAKELPCLENERPSMQQQNREKTDTDLDADKKGAKKLMINGSQSAIEPCRPSLTCWPAQWEPMEPDEFVRNVPLNTAGEEFKAVSKFFLQTLPNRKIICMKRIQSKFLWEHFCVKRKEMEKISGQSDIQEMNLFHGTKLELLEHICTENLDVRLSGTNVGAMFGEGTYFATTSKSANTYALPDPKSGHRFMLQVRVLVGKWTKGHNGLRRPPEIISEGRPRLYDSCVDNVLKPSIFCIFDRVQYYPEYIIEYE